MTDAEREALVERLAKTAYLTAYPTRVWETASATERRRWRRVAVSLLAVAEPVVREDCIGATREALNSYGRWNAAITPDTLMTKIEPAIRARGAA